MNLHLSGNGSVIINGRKHTGKVVLISGDKVAGHTVTVDGVCSKLLVNDDLKVSVVVNGDVDSMKLTAGDVTARNVRSISTVSGDVKCGDVSGSVGTVSGDVACGEVGGSVNTVSGDIVRA